TRASSEQFPDEGNSVNFQEILEEMTDADRDTGERLRRHLQFFFMNPLEKWKVRRQFPYKLALQVLKIIFVTVQLILFAEMRMSHVDFMEDTTTVMRHKFLKEWNDDRDALQYPPAEGRYSVYNGQGIFDHLSFIIDAYYSLQTDSFAFFSYDVQRPPKSNIATDNPSLTAGIQFSNIPYIQVCVDRINSVTINNNTYEFDITDVHACMHLNLTASEVAEIRANSSAVVRAFERRGVTFKSEDALIISKATLIFKLRTIHFSPKSGDQKPECYKISVSIVFDNSRHTGQVHVGLSTVISYVNVCNGRVIKGVGMSIDTLIMAITDVIVLLLCIFSLILCFRALIKAHLLKNKAMDYFENMFKIKMSISDQLDFLNLWYVMIVINDVLIIVGTLFKISIEFRDFDNSIFTLTGILLGMGALLVYVGVLRYFGFFNQYNILILTLKKSIPSMARFMSCAIVLYVGFLVAGWVIIGPYSMKFRTLGESSEALFSLMNGDDMFATFYTINDSNTTIKVWAGNDSNSVRALHFIDRIRDWACQLRGGSRFESFANPLNDQVDTARGGVVLSTQRV
ncbi:PKD channel domain containing protein, partial [Trichostrongylus colubriformis]